MVYEEFPHFVSLVAIVVMFDSPCCLAHVSSWFMGSFFRNFFMLLVMQSIGAPILPHFIIFIPLNQHTKVHFKRHVSNSIRCMNLSKIDYRHATMEHKM